MDPIRIRELLKPFTAHIELSEGQILQISRYLELLLKWNAKMNLTAVREPEAIIQRHFGESLFAAGEIATNFAGGKSLADVGSGPGFPGLPIKLAVPELDVTLIESQQKKATFLREVVRELKLTDIQVLNSRAESLHQALDIVTLRAVESFDKTLPIASKLVRTGGDLILLIGSEQARRAESLLPNVRWNESIAIPQSDQCVILIGRKA